MKHESLELVTNAEILQTIQKATIPGWRRAWYNKKAKTNISSYAEMTKKHQITNNLKFEDAFNVYLPNKIKNSPKLIKGCTSTSQKSRRI